jgi:uncharacterized protein (TIGR03435 family)
MTALWITAAPIRSCVRRFAQVALFGTATAGSGPTKNCTLIGRRNRAAAVAASVDRAARLRWRFQSASTPVSLATMLLCGAGWQPASRRAARNPIRAGNHRGGDVLGRIAFLLFLVAACSAAEQPVPGPQFEVASLKPSPPAAFGSPASRSSFDGGPGTSTPTRLTVRNFQLAFLIFRAYGIKAYQLSAPAWLQDLNFQTSAKFDIDATLAPGATQDQFFVMLQNLLVERFALKLRREQKEGPIYALALGKNGHKLKENVAPELTDPPQPASQPLGPDGFHVMPLGYTGMFLKPPVDRNLVFKFMRYSMPKFADFLSGVTGRPVADRTGLAGNYDFPLAYYLGSPTDADAGPDIYTAVQSQLGLRLVADKGIIETLIIDHADRTPSGN